MSNHQPLIIIVSIGILLVALLFCYAYGISNQYIYMPLCTFLGYRTSTFLIGKFYPTLYEPTPAPAPTTRQEKKKLARETHEVNKREQRLARLEGNAAKKTD
ncbi:hypothetical protein BGZ73_004633 [Actinomortierella ambigua]|nr:hypothetical protein BGZ73_004633 [Actinomortierella ambigua]